MLSSTRLFLSRSAAAAGASTSTSTSTSILESASSSSSSWRRPLLSVSQKSGNSQNRPCPRPRFFSSSSSTRANLRPPQPQQGSIPPYLWLGLAVPTGGTFYLYYKYLEEVPLTHRQRWIATSPEWERRLGDDEYQKLLQQFKGQILPKNHRASITVQRVGHRIALAADQFANEYGLLDFSSTSSAKNNKTASNKNTTFTVVRSDMANAFVLPGNHIFVMTGLFQFARDEDELAAVLGHEMAHNLARHVGEKVSGSLVVQLLARLSLLLDPSGMLMTLFLPTANLLRELPHSRIQELEADQIGMHLAAHACYDPAAAKRVFARMKEGTSNGQQPPEFLSTHPSHDSRIQKFDEWLPETKKILERDAGVPCRHMREDMAAARKVAAQRAVQQKDSK